MGSEKEGGGSGRAGPRLTAAEEALRAGDARPRIVRNKRVPVQYAPTGRKLFDEATRAAFLEWFSATANVSLSARKAGIHYRTVLRHRSEDAAFAARFERALETGMARVRAWALELGEEAGTEEVDVAVDMKPVNLTADMALQLIREDERRKAAAQAAALRGAAFGPRPGRAPTVATSAEVDAALAKVLDAYDDRMRAKERREAACAGKEEVEGEDSPSTGSGRAGEGGSGRAGEGGPGRAGGESA